MESYSRWENLLFYGVDEQRNETDRDCATKVLEILRKVDPEYINMQILKCHRKGKYVNGQKRLIIAKFSISDRVAIWLNKGNLKGTNIFVAEDFPIEVEKNRKILLPVFRHARMIESLKGKVSLKVDKLIIDGRTYTVDTLDKLPPSINPSAYSTRQNETMIVFHGTSSPFSNSYPCTFKEKGVIFNNVEQFIYYHKACATGDDIAVTRMLGTKHVPEQRRLIKSVDTVPKWIYLQRKTMKTGNCLKYEQNKTLADLLKGTGNRILGEANHYDKVCGTGIRLTDRQTLDDKSWPGNNIIGEILMSIREQLKSGLLIWNSFLNGMIFLNYLILNDNSYCWQLSFHIFPDRYVQRGLQLSSAIYQISDWGFNLYPVTWWSMEITWIPPGIFLRVSVVLMVCDYVYKN